MIRDTVREWVSDNLMPVIEEAYINRRFPRELVPQMAALGVFDREGRVARRRRVALEGVLAIGPLRETGEGHRHDVLRRGLLLVAGVIHPRVPGVRIGRRRTPEIAHLEGVG